MTRIAVLEPGQSVDYPEGYVARSWREQDPYYAERTGDTLSPEFATFDEARSWLGASDRLYRREDFAGDATYAAWLAHHPEAREHS